MNPKSDLEISPFRKKNRYLREFSLEKPFGLIIWNLDWIWISPKPDLVISPFWQNRKQWIFHVRPRRGSTINSTNLQKNYFESIQTIRNWYINWIGIRLARFFGTWKNHNWLGSSRFDFWQEHYHIIDWSIYSKLGLIKFLLVQFHLVHSSVQVTTWWWSKSSSG